MTNGILFEKLVDKSTLYGGISIPVAYQDKLYDMLGYRLSKGERHNLIIRMNGSIYADATLINEYYDAEKHPTARAEILQIRYAKNSSIAKALRESFPVTDALAQKHLTERHNSHMQLNIPVDEQEFIAISVEKGIVNFECKPIHKTYEIYQQPSSGEELTQRPSSDEDLPQRRDTTTNEFIRSATVVERARERARGRCQLCGQAAPFCDKNGVPYLEVHHIIWLSRGGTDTLSNTVALCPNCHSKMHIVDSEKDIKFLLMKTGQGI